MKRVFKRELKFQTWNEIQIIDDETNEFTQYMQNKEFGFTFSGYTESITKMGYMSAEDCIRKLTERNLLGNEIDYAEQIESERIGQINLKAEQERIKCNSEEYNIRLAALEIGG